MKRVLIVDDAIDLGRLLQDALKVTRSDTPITVVPSAEEALLESTRFKFDLLVTDLRLPGMSGLELIRKIRIRQPEIKVILITALMPEDRLVRQKDEVHPDIFIRKPLSVATFLEAVDSLIGAEPPDEPVVEEAPAAEEPAEVVDVGPVQEENSQEGTEAEAARPAAETPEGLDEALKDKEAATIGEAEAEEAQDEKIQTPDLLSELAAVFPDDKVENKTPAVIPHRYRTTKPAAESTADFLARLKGSLGAAACILTDHQGMIIAQEGELPDETFQEQLIPAALTALSGSTAVSYLLGTASSSSVQAFHGTEVDLVIAPVENAMLMVVLPSGRSALRLAIAFEEVLNAQEELVFMQNSVENDALVMDDAEAKMAQMMDIEKLGVTKSLRDEEIEEDMEETLVIVDPDLEKLDALVAGTANGETGLEDADRFWETAAASEKKDTSSPGFLTYEQAQELGLLNFDDEEEE